jgi:hypothetical protein
VMTIMAIVTMITFVIVAHVVAVIMTVVAAVITSIPIVVARIVLTPKICTGKGLTSGPSLVKKCHSAGKSPQRIQ